MVRKSQGLNAQSFKRSSVRRYKEQFAVLFLIVTAMRFSYYKYILA